MTNHLRTFLLNAGPAAAPSPPGEEYVSPYFLPRRETAATAKVRRALFGPRPDRALKNYRLWQLTAIIHSSELASEATYRDERLTYWPADPAERPFAATFGATVTPDDGGGSVAVVDGDGIGTPLLHAWVLTRVGLGAGTADLRVIRTTAPGTDVLLTVSVSENRTAWFALPGAPVRVSLAGISVATGPWSVAAGVRPAAGPLDVLQELNALLTSDDRAALFGGDRSRFATAWDRHPDPLIRLGVACLAAAELTEEQPPE